MEVAPPTREMSRVTTAFKSKGRKGWGGQKNQLEESDLFPAGREKVWGSQVLGSRDDGADGPETNFSLGKGRKALIGGSRTYCSKFVHI